MERGRSEVGEINCIYILWKHMVDTQQLVAEKVNIL
jgi:hypothetical protein